MMRLLPMYRDCDFGMKKQGALSYERKEMKDVSPLQSSPRSRLQSYAMPIRPTRQIRHRVQPRVGAEWYATDCASWVDMWSIHSSGFCYLPIVRVSEWSLMRRD